MVGVGATCAGDTCAEPEPPLPTITEQRSHFGLWAVLSSPLTLSMDFNNATLVDGVWAIVSNVDAIAVDQAWAGAPGGQLLQSAETVMLQHCTPGWAGDKNCTVPASQSWYKPLPGGAVALFITNNGVAAPADVSVPLSALPAGALPCAAAAAAGACPVYDVWRQAQSAPVTGSFDVAALAPHDSAFVVLGPWAGAGAARE